MNVVRNAVALAMLFAFVFAFGFLWYVLPQVIDKFYTATNTAQQSPSLDTTYLNYLSFKTLIIQGFYVLASLIVFFTFVSSIFDQQSLQGYMLSAIAGLIITPTVIYVITSFWNTFAITGISFGEISMVFITSFSQIMLVNFIAGLAAFIFIRRGQNATMS